MELGAEVLQERDLRVGPGRDRGLGHPLLLVGSDEARKERGSALGVQAPLHEQALEAGGGIVDQVELGFAVVVVAGDATLPIASQERPYLRFKAFGKPGELFLRESGEGQGIRLLGVAGLRLGIARRREGQQDNDHRGAGRVVRVHLL